MYVWASGRTAGVRLLSGSWLFGWAVVFFFLFFALFLSFCCLFGRLLFGFCRAAAACLGLLLFLCVFARLFASVFLCLFWRRGSGAAAVFSCGVLLTFQSSSIEPSAVRIGI